MKFKLRDRRTLSASLMNYTDTVVRGVARILGKGVLDYACKILSHAHLLTVKVEVQIVKENAF